MIPVEHIRAFVKEAAAMQMRPYGVSDIARSTKLPGGSPFRGSGGLSYSMPTLATHKTNPGAVASQKIVPPPAV